MMRMCLILLSWRVRAAVRLDLSEERALWWHWKPFCTFWICRRWRLRGLFVRRVSLSPSRLRICMFTAVFRLVGLSVRGWTWCTLGCLGLCRSMKKRRLWWPATQSLRGCRLLSLCGSRCLRCLGLIRRWSLCSRKSGSRSLRPLSAWRARKRRWQRCRMRLWLLRLSVLWPSRFRIRWAGWRRLKRLDRW